MSERIDRLTDEELLRYGRRLQSEVESEIRFLEIIGARRPALRVRVEILLQDMRLYHKLLNISIQALRAPRPPVGEEGDRWA